VAVMAQAAADRVSAAVRWPGRGLKLERKAETTANGSRPGPATGAWVETQLEYETDPWRVSFRFCYGEPSDDLPGYSRPSGAKHGWGQSLRLYRSTPRTGVSLRNAGGIVLEIAGGMGDGKLVKDWLEPPLNVNRQT